MILLQLGLLECCCWVDVVVLVRGAKMLILHSFVLVLFLIQLWLLKIALIFLADENSYVYLSELKSLLRP